MFVEPIPIPAPSRRTLLETLVAIPTIKSPRAIAVELTTT